MPKHDPKSADGEAVQPVSRKMALAIEQARIVAYENAQANFRASLDALEAGFVGQLNTFQAIMGGWFTEQQGFGQRNFGADIALLHSELSEALEADRDDAQSDKIPGFHGREEEFADVLVRLLHCADKYNLRLGEAFFAKMRMNLQRPFKHGKEY